MINKSKKVRKKPIEIKAYRYDETTKDKVLKLMQTTSKQPIHITETGFKIIKPRGHIHGKIGDWLIHEVNTDDEFWIIQEDIFYKTYKEHPNKKDTYTKIPIEVDAYQLTTLSEPCLKHIHQFLNSKIDLNTFITQSQDQGYVLIPTLEGDEKLNVNEWLIKGIVGEYYPVSEESFKTVFEII